jgi:hypothetical protein
MAGTEEGFGLNHASLGSVGQVIEQLGPDVFGLYQWKWLPTMRPSPLESGVTAPVEIFTFAKVVGSSRVFLM